MTVAELIEELRKHPPQCRVCLVYDSAACVESINRVVTWDRSNNPERHDLVVGLFDDSSAWELSTP